MKKRILAVIVVMLAAYAGLRWYGNCVRTERERALQAVVTGISKDTVTLNEVVPFAWDTVYTFAPYTPREEIEAVIGFRSAAIQEGYSEGILRLVFVKGRRVAAMVCATPQALGYTIVFDGHISHAENALFSVTRTGGIVQLTEIKKDTANGVFFGLVGGDGFEPSKS